MRNRGVTINYECKNCETKFEIQVSPYVPAKIYGPPEKCHPAEGGEFEPGECPNCGHEVDDDTVANSADIAEDEARCNAAERAADLKRDRQMGL